MKNFSALQSSLIVVPFCHLFSPSGLQSLLLQRLVYKGKELIIFGCYSARFLGSEPLIIKHHINFVIFLLISHDLYSYKWFEYLFVAKGVYLVQ